jgi:hypothetical protein
MKVPAIAKEKLDRAYPFYVELLANDAKVHQQNLLRRDTKVLKKNSSESDILLYLNYVHSELVFFANEEILQKLRQFGLKNEQLRWFIPIHEINKQFDSINENGVFVNKYTALAYIRFHLFYKFYRDLHAYPSINEHNTKNYPLFVANLKRRVDHSNKTASKKVNEFDDYINNLLCGFNNSRIPFDLNTHAKYSRGATEYGILRKMLEECFEPYEKKMKPAKIRSIVFDLFKLILNDDYKMEDFETFIYNSKKREENYNNYKAKVLRRILYKTENVV